MTILTPEEELALAKRVAAGDEEAKRLLVEHNMRLVGNIAKRYSGSGIPYYDLVQEGCIGLIKAANKFDHSLGFKFSTYATWWIRQSINRAITDKARMIRLPGQTVQDLKDMSKVVERLYQQNGREVTAEDLSNELGIPVAKAKLQLSHLRDPAVCEDVTGIILQSVLAPVDVLTEVVDKILCEKLHDLINGLAPREALVLKLRFGFGEDTPRALEGVGAIMKLSKERVRQIEKKALKKLRQRIEPLPSAQDWLRSDFMVGGNG